MVVSWLLRRLRADATLVCAKSGEPQSPAPDLGCSKGCAKLTCVSMILFDRCEGICWIEAHRSYRVVSLMKSDCLTSRFHLVDEHDALGSLLEDRGKDRIM